MTTHDAHYRNRVAEVFNSYMIEQHHEFGVEDVPDHEAIIRWGIDHHDSPSDTAMVLIDSALAGEPTRSWNCDACGRLIQRYRGDDDLRCECGAWYNSFGQRLRDDWMGNESNWDDDVSDLEGFERQQLRKELP
jgi:hypothetical protein